jgi:hypothetical protein
MDEQPLHFSVAESLQESELACGDLVSVTDFFDSYWKELENREWQAIVLHTWEDLPRIIKSDVDYAVKGPSPRDLLSFLANFSRSKGWRLVQVIEHEPSAFYCVCIRKRSPHVHLDLDVTWNYRRMGHHLVGSDILFDGKRKIPGKSFAVTSPGAEFTYLLAKAAAKGKDFPSLRERLAQLLLEDPEGCQRLSSEAFGDVPKFTYDDSNPLDRWALWFAESPRFKALRAGRRIGVREISLYLRRILHPTGFKISTSGMISDDDIRSLIDTLAPAFRRVVVRPRCSIIYLPWLLSRLIRTTLVIERHCDVPGMPKILAAGSRYDIIGECIESLASRVDHRIQSF